MVQRHAENELRLIIRCNYPDGQKNETEDKLERSTHCLRNAIVDALNKPSQHLTYKNVRCARLKNADDEKVSEHEFE